MTPNPTERQPFRTQVARRREVDQAIYLRAYDVINSLDRAENRTWWEKVLANFKSAHIAAPRVPLKRKESLAAPTHEILALPAPASHEPVIAVRPVLTGTPVLARRPGITPKQEIALVRTNPKLISTNTASLSGEAPKQISWVVLAVVVVLTAGLTFALIRFAWPSLASDQGDRRPKHAAVYLSKRSSVSFPHSIA